MTKDKPKSDKSFSVGKARDPKISGRGWTKVDGKDAGTDAPRDGWKTVKKEEK